jgi:hypothetical protein
MTDQTCIDLLTQEELDGIKDLAERGRLIQNRTALINAAYAAAKEDVTRWLMEEAWKPKEKPPMSLAAWAAAQRDTAIGDPETATSTVLSEDAQTGNRLQGADFGVRPGAVPAREPSTATRAPEPEPETIGPLGLGDAITDVRDQQTAAPASTPDLTAGGEVKWHEANPPHASITDAFDSLQTQWAAVGRKVETESTERAQAPLAGLADAGFWTAQTDFWLDLGRPSEALSQTERDRLSELEDKSMRGRLTTKEAETLPELIESIATKFVEVIKRREEWGESFAGFTADEDPAHIITDMKIAGAAAKVAQRQMAIRYMNPSTNLMEDMHICPPAEIDCAPARPGAMATAK